MKNTELAWAVLTSPSSAFAELREQPRFWFPLLALIISTVALTTWYYSIVDISWLMDQMMSGNPNAAQMTDQQRAAIAATQTRGFLMVSSAIGVAIALAVFKVLEALYYSLAGKVTNQEQSFRHWLALASWSSLPSLLGIVPSVVMLLISETSQIDSSAMAVLSLNEVFFHIPMGGKGFTLATSLTLLHPWVWWLAVLGVRLWTGRSWLYSTIFTLLPTVLIYGIWAVIAFK